MQLQSKRENLSKIYSDYAGAGGPSAGRGSGQRNSEKLQYIDDNGYSGHISFILHLIKNPKFRKQYLFGEFNPAKIETFGKVHGIIINQMVRSGDGGPDTIGT